MCPPDSDPAAATDAATGAGAACTLCVEAGGQVLLRHRDWRIVLADEPLHPAFCRVIWHDHVREMTDLAPAARHQLMEVVWAVEQALRAVLPDCKINLASLGNVVPHLHWHVIARFSGDPHFPAPVWAAPRGTAPADLPAGWRAQLTAHLASLLPSTDP